MSACLTRSEPVCAVTRHMLTPFYSVFLLDTSCALPALLNSPKGLGPLFRFISATGRFHHVYGSLDPRFDDEDGDGDA